MPNTSDFKESPLCKLVEIDLLLRQSSKYLSVGIFEVVVGINKNRDIAHPYLFALTFDLERSIVQYLPGSFLKANSVYTKVRSPQDSGIFVKNLLSLHESPKEANGNNDLTGQVPAGSGFPRCRVKHLTAGCHTNEGCP